jgi:hypothetical protein
MKQLWKNYSLSIVLATLFLVAWVLQTWTGWVHFAAEQREHGQAAQWFGEGGYIWQWAAVTMENWQSEFLQLFTFVLLTAYLIHKGSHESKDTDDEMMGKLDAILERVERLEKGEAATGNGVGAKQPVNLRQ